MFQLEASVRLSFGRLDVSRTGAKVFSVSLLPSILFYTHLETLPAWMRELTRLEYLYVPSSTVVTFAP